MPSQNKGEKDEILIINRLLQYNNDRQYNKLTDIFGEEANEGVIIIDPSSKKEITRSDEIKKAASLCKADIIVRVIKDPNVQYNISIKSQNGAKPAILNHTHRNANVFKENGLLNQYLPSIDSVSKEYIDKRTQKYINEDTALMLLNSMNDEKIKNDIKKIIAYFIFEGTGSRESKTNANSVLTYKGTEISFLKCIDENQKMNYINSIIDRCIISFRNKGMPKKINDAMKPWIYEDVKNDGNIKKKGCLHIRL